MRKIIILFILLLNVSDNSAQIILSEDTNFCVPQQHDLYALSAVQSSMDTDFMEEHIIVVWYLETDILHLIQL